MSCTESRQYENPPGEKDFILVNNTEDADLLCALFKTTYKELHARRELMNDFSYHFTVNRLYMEHIERLYDDPRPGGFVIRRSLGIRIYNPLYGYPLCRSRIANPNTQNNRITNPIGRRINYPNGQLFTNH